MITRAIISLFAILSTLSIAGNWLRPFDFFSHIQIWLPIPLIIITSLSLFLKKRPTLLICWMSILTIYHTVMIYPYIPRLPHKQIKNNTSLKILQCNLYARNLQRKEVIKTITKINPDIFVICEASQYLIGQMEHLHKTYPYRIQAGRWPNRTLQEVSGTILWSKHPFTKQEKVELDKAKIQMLRSTIQYNGTSIDVFAAHLPAPVNRSQMTRRNDGLREISNLIELKQSTLLIGDLNNTVFSAGLKQLMKETKLDSVYKNNGFNPTWPAYYFPLGISIDHIFKSSDWKVTHLKTQKLPGSDHRMLIAELQHIQSAS